MTTEYEYSLIVRTDSYTGNTDSAILAILFGIDDDRYHGDAIERHKDYVKGHEDIFKKYLSDVVDSRPTEEYGSCMYSINDDFNDDYNSLEIYISPYNIDKGDFKESNFKDIISTLRTIFGEEISYQGHGVFDKIKILSYHVKVKEISTKIYDME